MNEKLEVDKIKPLITLKPVSQLKEISLFGSSFDDVDNNSKKRKSSFNDYRNRKLIDENKRSCIPLVGQSNKI